MLSVLGKMQNFLLGSDEEDDDNYIEDKTTGFSDPYPAKREYERRVEKRDNVTKLYPDARYQIMLSKPRTLEDATGVINSLRTSNVCVVSLEGVENKQAQRIVDFLSGSAYALGSVIERISNEIFIVAPDGVSISGKLKSDLKSDTAVFPWITR